MKKIEMFLSILLFVILFQGIVKSSENDNKEKIKTFIVAKGGELYVEINPGDITVKTWEKEEVSVKVSGIEEDQFKNVEMTSEKNLISVRYEKGYNSDDANFIITVPVKFNLELITSAGNIYVKNNIDGNVKANTNGGDVSCKNVSGNLTVESMGGNIGVDDVDGSLSVNTMGGDINIGMIKGNSAKVNTMGGEINIGKSVSGIAVKTSGGDIAVGDAGGDSEFITYGGNISIGNISGNVKMETSGGNLTLGGANGLVRGKTNGGNIDFKDIKGSVDIKTMAGEVTLVLNPESGSESRISTNAGSIELTIPSSAKTTIEARIHVQGNWKTASDNYQIDSDFPVKSTYNDEEKHDIVGTYELNGGGSKILLKATNSDISIIKESKK
jgi:DUF4097 and DUF4098 domain-containing protein YvlB